MLAVPLLVKRILSDLQLWDFVILDERPFQIGELNSISGRKENRWPNLLKAALKRGNVGAVLAIIDGDSKRWEGGTFCPAIAARLLSQRARTAGAGTTFSMAFVFACSEYETWLLAGVESLAGKTLSDGRPGVRAGEGQIVGDLESAPRDAKRALGELMTNGYKPTLDQAELTKLLDLSVLRRRGLRSFTRLESAIKLLAEACRTASHISSPSPPG